MWFDIMIYSLSAISVALSYLIFNRIVKPQRITEKLQILCVSFFAGLSVFFLVIFIATMVLIVKTIS